MNPKEVRNLITFCIPVVVAGVGAIIDARNERKKKIVREIDNKPKVHETEKERTDRLVMVRAKQMSDELIREAEEILRNGA